jgi:DNA-binding response OmpR family regulator
MGSECLLQDKVILIVDDEPDVLDTIAELIDMCRVHKAKDYDTALICAGFIRPKIMILRFS